MVDPDDIHDLTPTSEDAVCLARYLRTHPPAGRARSRFSEFGATTPAAPLFLAKTSDGTMWLVRWPDGRAKWESLPRLEARGVAPPAVPLIAHGQFTDPAVAADVAERERESLHRQGRL